MSARAEKVIAVRDAEMSRQSNFRQLWQDTADWILPMMARITTTRTPGEPLGAELYDITARTEARNMASGLSAQIIPAGHEFFDLQTSDRTLVDDPEVQEYLARLTEGVHEEMFATNFIEELNAALLSLVSFGISDIFPHWSNGLVYRTYPIGSYQVRESADGIIDTKILTVKRTARQLYQKYGEAIGDHVRKALEAQAKGQAQEDEDSRFEVIQIIQPRDVFTPGLLFGKRNKRNLPFESVHVGVMDKNILLDEGFDEFPDAIARWWKSPGEVYGRGQGTEILPQVLKLNQMEADKTQAGNRWNEPPLEVLDSFDGNVNLSPRAQNFVTQLGSIAAIDLGAKGSYPIAREELDQQRMIIKDAFFHDAFEPLGDLQGDRRNELEIRGRMGEAFKKLAQPLGRVFGELLDPLIGRSTKLLIDNGVLEPPPPQLNSVKIVYVGPMALALRDQHVTALDNWLLRLERIEAIQPGIVDNLEGDEAARDTARFLGVKESHIRSIVEVRLLREEREREQRLAEEMQAAQLAAQAYGQTNQAPAEGSPAEALKEAI
jgi:hypothetical protein